MSAKYVSNAEIQVNDFDDFECSERTTAIDYLQIRKSAIALLGSIEICVGCAVKLNLHGQRLKGGDYFSIKGTQYLMSDVKELLEAQDGYKAAAAKALGVGRDSDKTLVSFSRIARAFAAEVILLIERKKVKVDETLARHADEASLPVHFAFVNARFGMKPADMKEHSKAFIAFCGKFDELIGKAASSGWVTYNKDNKRRLHKREAESFFQFVGVIA